jgi:RNA recognition motif-containing protein
LIKDKDSDHYKDFAFIEFHSIEDSTFVLDRAKQDRIKIRGVPVFLSYSRFKRPEQYVT